MVKTFMLKNLGNHISEKFAKDFFQINSIKDEHEFNDLLAEKFSAEGWNVEREKILGTTRRKIDLYVETPKGNFVIETKDTRNKRRTGYDISLNTFFKKVVEGQKQLNKYRKIITKYWEFKDLDINYYCLCLLVEDEIADLEILNTGITTLIYDNISFVKIIDNNLVLTKNIRIKDSLNK